MYEERHDMSKVDRELMIELENVDKFFGSFQALKGVNLTVGKLYLIHI